MGKSQRDKGARWERELVQIIRKRIPSWTVRRGYQSRGGIEEPDVTAGRFSLEAKHGVSPSPRRALRQAVESAGDSGLIPCAVVKYHRGETIAVMRFDDFLDLIDGQESCSKTQKARADEEVL